jgi:retinitis pigmentosa 9 protein
MQCWRCKQYGHRTGDRECPLFLTGNIEQDARRQASEPALTDHHACISISISNANP